MKTQTSRKTNAPAIASATPIPTPQTHDEAPAPDLTTQLSAAAQGHSFGALDVSVAPAGAIQPKLTVGAPDDQYEAEADRVASQVMRMPDPTVQRAEMLEEDDELVQTRPAIQRAAAPDEDDELVQTKPIVQRAADGSFDAGADVASRIGARRGSGSPLPESTRQFMEPRFGADFSGVRLHTDGEADRLSQDLSARAFTTGSDIYFRRGEYSPTSGGGQELLAHELTHVAQQWIRSTRTTGNLATSMIQRMMSDYDDDDKDPSGYEGDKKRNGNKNSSAESNDQEIKKHELDRKNAQTLSGAREEKIRQAVHTKLETLHIPGQKIKNRQPEQISLDRLAWILNALKTSRECVAVTIIDKDIFAWANSWDSDLKKDLEKLLGAAKLFIGESVDEFEKIYKELLSMIKKSLTSNNRGKKISPEDVKK